MRKSIKMVALCLAFCTVLIIAMPALAVSPPSGYTFTGSNTGNGTIDAAWDGFAALIACSIAGFLPLGGIVSFSIAAAILAATTKDAIKTKGKFSGYYIQQTWKCNNPGIYPYIYWHKRLYYEDNNYQKMLYETSWYEYAQLPAPAPAP